MKKVALRIFISASVLVATLILITATVVISGSRSEAKLEKRIEAEGNTVRYIRAVPRRYTKLVPFAELIRKRKTLERVIQCQFFQIHPPSEETIRLTAEFDYLQDISAQSFTPDQLRTLGGNTALRQIVLNYPTAEKVNALLEIKTLESLIILSRRNQPSITPLASLPNLNRIRVMCRTNSSFSVTELAGFTNLVHLTIYVDGTPTGIYAQQLDLSILPNLQQLRIYPDQSQDSTPYTIAASGISSLRELQLLSIDNVLVTPELIGQLAALPGLEALSLRNTDLTDDDAYLLGTSPSLKYLDARDTLVSRNIQAGQLRLSTN